MTAARLDAAAVRKNRWILILLLSTFVIPFVIGHLAYTRGWYQGGQTNHGQLLQPAADFFSLKATQQGRELDADFLGGKWWLVYVMPRECTVVCEQSLAQLRQVRRAAGRDTDRLQILILTQSELGRQATSARADAERWAQVDIARLSEQFAGLPEPAADAGYSYLMDPLGIIMLAYAPQLEPKAAVLQGEGMLLDIKKLLKVSQIG